ncbi:ATP-binding protein [Candidatus Pacearchaeota archaeon]|nr:ATP-binding protein [Candidatus Pacearchaeota archaeon]
MEITNTRDVSAQYLKILVHGAAGSGKTRLCGTTGGKTVILSAESGLLSLAGQDIDVIEIKTMADLYGAFAFLQTDTIYDWVCLDSISEIAEVVLATEKAKTKDPRQAYGELQTQMMQLLRGFRDLPKNVYFSAKQDRAKDEVTGGMIFAPSAPGTKVAPAMPYLFDLVFALHNWKDEEGNVQSALQTQRCAQYEAKDRSGKLEMVEPADLGAIHTKIVGKPKTTKQKKGTK